MSLTRIDCRLNRTLNRTKHIEMELRTLVSSSSESESESESE